MMLFMHIYLISVNLFLYLWTDFDVDIQVKICEYKSRIKTGHVTALAFEVNLFPIPARFVESINYNTGKLH